MKKKKKIELTPERERSCNDNLFIIMLMGLAFWFIVFACGLAQGG